MRGFIVVAIIILMATRTYTQSLERYLWKPDSSEKGKPILDFKGIDHWIGLRVNDPYSFALSRNGRYCSYVIDNQPYGSFSLVIQSTGIDGWKQDLAGINPGFFSGNNREYVFQRQDSLCFLMLGKGNIRAVKEVSDFQLPADDKKEWIAIRTKGNALTLLNLLNGKEQKFENVKSFEFDKSNQWFCCLLGNAAKELVVIRLLTGKIYRYTEVVSYGFDYTGRVLILKNEGANENSLKWVEPAAGKLLTIWTSKNKDEWVRGHTFDKDLRRLAFVVQERKGQDLENTIWYYRQGMHKAVLKADNQSVGIDAGLIITGIQGFGGHGHYIGFYLQPKEEKRKKLGPSAAQVDVWHYRDTFLMSAQLLSGRVKGELEKPVKHTAVIPSDKTGTVQVLTGEKESVLLNDKKDYVLVWKMVPTDRYWEVYARNSVSLVRLKDNKRLPFFLKDGFSICLPEEGNWLIMYDAIKGIYYKYDNDTDTYIKLSFIEREKSGESSNDAVGNRYSRIAGWAKGYKSLLVYDEYDIWELDLTGKKPAVNLTGGYGRKHKVRFEIMPGQAESGMHSTFTWGSSLLLIAFDEMDKQNGFYKLQLGSKNEPEMLFMGAWMMYLGGLEYGLYFNKGLLPLKARDTDTWMVLRQSATEAPNLYLTHDLKSFKALTDIQPEKDYNWFTTELIRYPQLDGSIGQGVLYKPENFDSTKKYPVLFNYYHQSTQRVYQYPQPFYTWDAHINIPWFVSRGYLICTPDIYFNKKFSGVSALNAVEGAAAYLSKKSYVDSSKMAISGHSMAGGLTNYILTHSQRFAAVFEGAGASDWISANFQLSWDDGMTRLPDNKMWAQKNDYYDNPIMHVDKVTSPLLIFHCKKDSGMPWEQAVELFQAMRSLGKKVWMLQYDRGNHAVLNPDDYRDLTVRVTQFFDYYLKGAPAPHWMTVGVPAKLKEIESGLKLDRNGSKP
jgi:dienelactone hydrolase